MLRLRTVCLAAVALAAAGFFVGRMLVAQDSSDKAKRPGRSAGAYGLGKLALLKVKEVQKDLQLTDAQRETLDKFATDMQSQVRTQFEGLRDLSQEERQAKMAELRTKMQDREKEVQKKLDEVLNTQQRERLAQIELQARRVSMFAQKEVAEGLELTDEQKQKLTDLVEKIRTEMRDARNADEETRAKLKKMVDESMDKAKEILTSEQREKLDKMLGKKLDIDMSQLGLGGFGGRGGRRGQGRGPTDRSSDKSTEKSADKSTDKSTDKPAEKTDSPASPK
jgi:Spy/CpxP family protein refolding chaperone